MMTVYDYSAKLLTGADKSLSDYKGNVLLIVNTASRCGFTPQYKGLQSLYETYRSQGFEVLAFPSNQFAGQEPGSSEEIQQFCDLNYSISFPMFEKIDVKGTDAHPLYHYLTNEARGFLGTRAIKWNFTKFLIDRQGRVVKRYAPTDKPEDLESDIQKLLAE